AFPPSSSSTLLPASLGPLTVAGAATYAGKDFMLMGPTPPPPGTSITEVGRTPSGLPIVYWAAPLTLTTKGCPGGSATYEVTQDGVVVRDGTLTDGGTGTYTASLDPLQPAHGDARVAISIACPDPSINTDLAFDLYIDPSGTVRTTHGEP